jgi:hypothetical protein
MFGTRFTYLPDRSHTERIVKRMKERQLQLIKQEEERLRKEKAKSNK